MNMGLSWMQTWKQPYFFTRIRGDAKGSVQPHTLGHAIRSRVPASVIL